MILSLTLVFYVLPIVVFFFLILQSLPLCLILFFLLLKALYL